MSGWKIITRDLYAAGGGPLPRKAFDRHHPGGGSNYAIQRAARLGLIASAKRGLSRDWTITARGIDWCSGRIEIVGSSLRSDPDPHADALRVERLVSDATEAAAACRRLTHRQAEVLVLVAKGFTCKEVGARAGLASKSVNGHLKRIYQVLGCSRAVEAAVVAAKAGLV